MTSGISRRQTLAGAAAGVGVPLLAACGGDGGGGGDAGTTAEPTPTSSSPTPRESESASPSEAATSEPAASPTEPVADSLAKAADVPEGGGTILAREKVVVTQPVAGEFKCFTAVCTHRGCVVSSVEGGTINCACHGSRFSIADGSVQNGPAGSALSAVPISVQGGSISRA